MPTAPSRCGLEQPAWPHARAPSRNRSASAAARVLIGPGQEQLSDPLPLATDDRQAVQVSVFVPGPATVQTFHWEGRQTSWIAPGDQSRAQALNAASSTTARLLLTGIDVEAGADARSVVVIGIRSPTVPPPASTRTSAGPIIWPRAWQRGHSRGERRHFRGRLLRDGMGESARSASGATRWTSLRYPV